MIKPTWESLPLEIWIRVFDQCSSRRDLAQCRLVCKTWDPFAEKALFSQPVPFPKSKKRAVKLHYHLARKPFLGRYIKKVQIVSKAFQRSNIEYSDPLIIDLFRLLFTPEIEEISGLYQFNDFCGRLLDTVNESPRTFSHLKRLPDIFDEGVAASQLAFKVKDTLEFIHLAYSPRPSYQPSQLVATNLDKFVRLRDVELSLALLSGIEGIHQILQQLQNVESISLKLQGANRFTTLKPKSELKAWLKQHVSKNNTLKRLVLSDHSFQRPGFHLLDYVFYRYTHLETLKIDALDVGTHLDEALNVMGHIPHIQLTEVNVKEPHDLWRLGHTLKCTTNSIQLDYYPHEPIGLSDGVQVFEISKNSNTQHTKFNITLSSDLSHAFVKQLLSSVCTATSRVTCLDLNLHLYKNAQDESPHQMSFYNILKMVPHVEELKFCDERIKHQTADFDTLALHDLTCLQFYGAKIDAGVLSHISKIAPTLHHLDLSSCYYLLDGDDEYQHQMMIDMPHSTLDAIAIMTGKHDDVYEEVAGRREIIELKNMDKTINSMSKIYLCVMREGFSAQHFILDSDQNISITTISKEEHALLSKGSSSAKIHIHCRSLKTLLLDFSEYGIQMVWDDNDKLLYRTRTKEWGDYLAMKEN